MLHMVDVPASLCVVYVAKMWGWGRSSLGGLSLGGVCHHVLWRLPVEKRGLGQLPKALKNTAGAAGDVRSNIGAPGSDISGTRLDVELLNSRMTLGWTV